MGLFKAWFSDAKSLNILANDHGIDVRRLAPKGSSEFELLIRYMKDLRDVGCDERFVADQLAYNFQNYGSLTRTDEAHTGVNTGEPTNVLEETIEASKHLSFGEKLKVAQAILNKINGYQALVAKLDSEVIARKWVATKAFLTEQLANEIFSPADVAMCFLYLLSVRLQKTPELHADVVEVMTNLVEASPDGSLTEESLSRPVIAIMDALKKSELAEDKLGEEIEAPEPLAQGASVPAPAESTPSDSEIDHEENASSSTSESALVTSEEVYEYGEDLVLLIRRGCRDIMTMTVIAEDDLSAEGGSISAEDIRVYGEEFVEVVRVIADEVRLELGGYPVRGYRCRTLKDAEISDFGEYLIDLIIRIAYEEAGCPEKYNSLFTSEEIDDYGRDLIDFIRRGCRDIMTMAIVAEDDLSVAGGTFSAEEVEDYGEDLIELIRVIADEVRLKLGGYPVHGNRCRTLTETDFDDYGEDLISLVIKIAYLEAGCSEKYRPVFSAASFFDSRR